MSAIIYIGSLGYFYLLIYHFFCPFFQMVCDAQCPSVNYTAFSVDQSENMFNPPMTAEVQILTRKPIGI